MVLMSQEFWHLPQQKSHKFCSWDNIFFEQNWKNKPFKKRIKSGPGPMRDRRLKDWNLLCCENSLRAIHSDFKSSFALCLNTAAFQIKSYFTTSFQLAMEVPGPAWDRQGAQRHLQDGAHPVPAPHHHYQGRRLLLQTQTSILLWCQRSPQEQISQAFPSDVTYWGYTLLLLTEAKHQVWSS